MISKLINLDSKDKYYLAILTIISIALTIWYINFSLNLGQFCSDVYVYLANALYYSGKNVGVNNDLWLTPLICILTSIFFDFGLKNQVSLYIVTGILAIIGNIGLYLLFRFKLDKITSFLGVIVYTTFALNLIWSGNGTLDIPAVSLIIWTVLFAVIAINKNPKFYIYTIIVFILAFFVRYTVILILPSLILYFIFKKKYKAPWSELKYIVIPIVVFVVVVALALIIMSVISDMPRFVTLGLDYIGGYQGSTGNTAYNINLYYYIENFFNFLSCSNITFPGSTPQLNQPTIISALYGILIVIGAIFAVKDNLGTKISKKFIPITLVLAIITIYSFLSLGSSITIVLLFFTFISLRKIFKSDKFDFNLMLISWALINFIFFSYLHFKVNRYFIPSLPVVAYFIVLGVYKINNHFKINKYIIPVVLTVVLLFGAFSLINIVDPSANFKGPEDMGNFIVNEVSDYKDVKIASNTVRPFKWYLQKYVFPIKEYDLDKLYDFNITYYITNQPIDNLTNFTEVKTIEGYHLYKSTVH
ncbi:MAG: glycosyltransferase family 39 protein [Methanobrevibacter sp.]|nr:glycosyltransferase family 39 protein [Methanobrevibacter sp.]